jgi:ribonuclease P protein component
MMAQCQSAVYTPLRRRADFTRVHTQGRRKGDNILQVRVLHRPVDEHVSATVRLGTVVSKKYGRAVQRNRFKRLVRAAIRALAPDLTPGWDILVLPREAHEVKMADVLQSLRSLLGALGVLRTDNPSAEGGAR